MDACNEHSLLQTVMPLPSSAAYVDQGKLVVLDSHLSLYSSR